MSSFFTLPAPHKKKRKRDETGPTISNKRQDTTPGHSTDAQSAPPKKTQRDESISGSESDEEEFPKRSDAKEEDTDGSNESDIEDETGAEQRLRLAERYLDNIKGEIDETGFDAEQIDRDLIAERLKEDVAETKGRLYRHIASEYTFSTATKCQFRADTLSTTSIAACPPYAYTVSKDLCLTKWEIISPPLPAAEQIKESKKSNKQTPSVRRRPIKLLSTKGNIHKSNDPTYQYHTAPILTVAASSDGRFVVTGGADRRLIIWSAADLVPLRVFAQHRDAVTSLALRRGTNQLYSASKDRTIKVWSLNELAYVETLFGHQDEVLDVATLAAERCLSVGARDRTARLWKVVEETQLVFRGGGGGRSDKKSHENPAFAEGSIDRVAFVDDETFVTGSDNGSLSLWSVHKKKPVFIVPLAHGLDPALSPEEAYAEQDTTDRKVASGPQPRWLTALAVVPYSDLVISGSWDGCVRVWKISGDMRRIEPCGVVGAMKVEEGTGVIMEGEIGTRSVRNTRQEVQIVKGVINDICVFERGEKGKNGLCIMAAVGNEHRLGRWKKVKGRNGAILFEVQKATV